MSATCSHHRAQEIPSGVFRDAYVAALFQDNLTWEYCDNPYDLDAAADSALRATVRYQSAQQAHEVPLNRALPVRQWPDAESRVGELHAALVFAAECVESVWTGPLEAMLQSWLRARLNTLLAPPAGTEPYPRFEERIRHATRLTHRYRATLHGLFGDRMWADRPVDRWWCPDDDLAVHGSFHELGGARRPTYALLLHGPGRATLAVAATATGAPRWHTVEVSAEGLIASGDRTPTIWPRHATLSRHWGAPYCPRPPPSAARPNPDRITARYPHGGRPVINDRPRTRRRQP